MRVHDKVALGLALIFTVLVQPRLVAATPSPPQLSQRYIVFLDGINSSSNPSGNCATDAKTTTTCLNNDFGTIKHDLISQLGRYGMSRSHFVYFSYSSVSGNAERNIRYCDAWRSCKNGNLRNLTASPVYVSGDTHLAIYGQTSALDWLLRQIVAQHVRAQIDVVGYSLGGVVASYWAATHDRTSRAGAHVRALILIESPVGGLPLAGKLLSPSCDRSAICTVTRSLLENGIGPWPGVGPKILEELQLSKDNPKVSIVSSLSRAARNFPVASIQSTFDYMVNQTSLPITCVLNCSAAKAHFEMQIGKGTQGWTGVAADNTYQPLGGSLARAPLPVLQAAKRIVDNHGSPLHYINPSRGRDAPDWVAGIVGCPCRSWRTVSPSLLDPSLH
jgi:pimeloyl-ACP methyl ester carboxylesterase